MSGVILSGDVSGTVTLAPPSAAGSNTINVPAATGTMVVTGQSATVSQSMLAANVAGNGPAFSAYPTGNTALTAAVATLIALAAKTFDTGGCFNSTGSTVTLNGLSVPAYSFCPNVAGYYQVTLAFAGNSGTSQTTNTALYKNGSPYSSGAWLYNLSGGGVASGTMLVYLNGVGDYIQMYVTSSLAMGTTANSFYTYFSGLLVRAA